MNSFMFTFSADQTSLQLCLQQKQQASAAQTFRRRPTSSKTTKQDKRKRSSSKDNQLFENPHNMSSYLEESPQNGLNLLKIKNSSMQLQEKKKLRSIIDTMLGKNFELENNPKLDSIVFTNRKNLNKQRSYLTGNKKNQQKSKDYNDNDSKQNHPNDQNINDEQYVEKFENVQKINKPNLKLKKFEFAAIKINKKSQFSQRYPEIENQEKEENQNQPFSNRRCVNVSRESIDRESLGKKLQKSKTPKIMYPQSDSKLPSVFRNNKHRNSIGQSLRKRTRISSAYYLPQTEDKIIEQEPIILRKKRTLENTNNINNEVMERSKFRPKSTMIETKRYSSQYESADHLVPSQFCPKKLIFDCNQQLSGDISRKLGSAHVESRHNGNMIRITTRSKSIHSNYVHRKLRDINSAEHLGSLNNENEPHQLIKNDSAQTKETTEESTLRESLDNNGLPNISENLVSSIELREFGLGCSVTFQVQKS